MPVPDAEGVGLAIGIILSRAIEVIPEAGDREWDGRSVGMVVGFRHHGAFAGQPVAWEC